MKRIPITGQAQEMGKKLLMSFGEEEKNSFVI
jgi:hypothetical protein